MLTMRDHDVEDYIALRDMDATDVGQLTQDDRECLTELGQYLVDVGAAHRFAMWLLHKHFDPAPGEVFVERAATSVQRIETTPVERSRCVGELHATAFRFAPSMPGVGIVAMELAASDDLGGAPPLGRCDENVLAGIVERLRAHGKTERFGVKLIRDPLGLSEGELLLETCDTTQRALYCDVTARDAIPSDSTVIETTWRYRLAHGHTEAVVMRDCTAGCISVPGGHDIGHDHSQTDNDDNPIP